MLPPLLPTQTAGPGGSLVAHLPQILIPPHRIPSNKHLYRAWTKESESLNPESDPGLPKYFLLSDSDQLFISLIFVEGPNDSLRHLASCLAPSEAFNKW